MLTTLPRQTTSSQRKKNRRAFQKITFRPRCLRNVACVDMTTTILGNRTSMPIYIWPTGLGKYAHPDAERALARAAGKDGIIQLIPNSPSTSIEKIFEARSSPHQVFFHQVYVNRNPQLFWIFGEGRSLGIEVLPAALDHPHGNHATILAGQGYGHEGRELLTYYVVARQLPWAVCAIAGTLCFQPMGPCWPATLSCKIAGMLVAPERDRRRTASDLVKRRPA